MSYKYNTPPVNQFGKTPVKDYLDAKDFREQRLWTFANGILVTEVNGEYLTRQEFDKRFPSCTPIDFKRGRENIDGTTNWIL